MLDASSSTDSVAEGYDFAENEYRDFNGLAMKSSRLATRACSNTILRTSRGGPAPAGLSQDGRSGVYVAGWSGAADRPSNVIDHGRQHAAAGGRPRGGWGQRIVGSGFTFRVVGCKTQQTQPSCTTDGGHYVG